LTRKVKTMHQQVHTLGLKVATINPHKSWAGLSNEAKLPKNLCFF
jgi:hypothetical protein